MANYFNQKLIATAHWNNGVSNRYEYITISSVTSPRSEPILEFDGNAWIQAYRDSHDGNAPTDIQIVTLQEHFTKNTRFVAWLDYKITSRYFDMGFFVVKNGFSNQDMVDAGWNALVQNTNENVLFITNNQSTSGAEDNKYILFLTCGTYSYDHGGSIGTIDNQPFIHFGMFNKTYPAGIGASSSYQTQAMNEFGSNYSHWYVNDLIPTSFYRTDFSSDYTHPFRTLLTLTPINNEPSTKFFVYKTLFEYNSVNGWYEEIISSVSDQPHDPGGDEPEPEPEVDPTHPFPSTSDQDNAGGGGTGDIETQPQDADDLPTFAYNGYVTALTPTGVQMGNIMNYLLGNLNDRGTVWDEIINVLKNTYGNPMDYIVGCHVLPISVPSSQTVQMIVNNTQTLIISNKADDTYFRLSPEDDGNYYIPKVHIPKPSGSFLDYSPYMDISIFIPFIGMQNLKPEDVVDKWIGLYYYIDIISGNFSVRIRVDDNENDTNGKFLYHYSGNFAQTLPLTGNSYNNLMIATANLAGSIAMSPSSNIPASVIGLAQNTIPQVQRSGGFGGASSLLTYKKPYVYITYPDYLDPAVEIDEVTTYRSSLQGNETYIVDKLTNLTGFTVVKDVHLDNIPALDDEINEIETLLKEGVIL